MACENCKKLEEFVRFFRKSYGRDPYPEELAAHMRGSDNEHRGHENTNSV